MKHLLKEFLDQLDQPIQPRPDLEFIWQYPSIKSWVDAYLYRIETTFEYASEHQSRMISTAVYGAITKQLYDRADPDTNTEQSINEWKKSLEKLNTFLALKGY